MLLSLYTLAPAQKSLARMCVVISGDAPLRRASVQAAAIGGPRAK